MPKWLMATASDAVQNRQRSPQKHGQIPPRDVHQMQNQRCPSDGECDDDECGDEAHGAATAPCTIAPSIWLLRQRIGATAARLFRRSERFPMSNAAISPAYPPYGKARRVWHCGRKREGTLGTFLHP